MHQKFRKVIASHCGIFVNEFAAFNEDTREIKHNILTCTLSFDLLQPTHELTTYRVFDNDFKSMSLLLRLLWLVYFEIDLLYVK